MEFRAANGGLKAVRYLTDGRKAGVRMFSAADGYVYILKHEEGHRYVSAFRVSR